jgi:hypothetical protein
MNLARKRLLQQASRSKIEDYYVSFQKAFRSNKWLHKTNRYRQNCISLYKKDISPRATTLNHHDLIAYISASAPTHVIDGWSYLGRAVDATLRGDNYSAIHFGYYAELRAAMSLLSSEGIGIFGKTHPIVKNNSKTDPFKGQGTHSDIWPILKYWATLRRATDLLDDVVRPNSIKLSAWLNGTRVKIPVQSVAQHWLKSWGLDLAVVDDDHDCRNLASYRPSEFRRPNRLPVHDQTTFVEELWQLFEPSTEQRFPYIERLLLRNAYRKGPGIIPSINDLKNLGLTSIESTDWIAFLQRTDDSSPLKLAEKWVPVEDSTCHLRIISRAVLLLFVASAAARRLLSNAGYSLDDILFWWGQFGESRALWDNDSVLEDPRDLWADIAQAISDSNKWHMNNPNSNISLRKWRRSNTSALIDFGGFELVGIWALMP